MGSIRVNLTNGSSKYINLDNSTTASVVDASRQSTTIDVDGNPYEIPRFETSNGGALNTTFQNLTFGIFCLKIPSLGWNSEHFDQPLPNEI